MKITYIRLPTCVRWTLSDASGKTVTNGAQNNMRLAKKSAEHAQRMNQKAQQ